VILRKGPVLDAGGYCFPEHGAAEDYELWSRLAQYGVRFANHPEPLLRYRVHPGQMKYTHLRATIRAILRVKEMYWSSHMDFRARARNWIEWSMLALPPSLVLRLFILTQYRQRLAASKCSSSFCRTRALNGWSKSYRPSSDWDLSQPPPATAGGTIRQPGPLRRQ